MLTGTEIATLTVRSAVGPTVMVLVVAQAWVAAATSPIHTATAAASRNRAPVLRAVFAECELMVNCDIFVPFAHVCAAVPNPYRRRARLQNDRGAAFSVAR